MASSGVTPAVPQDQPSRLLNLPAELQLSIYELVIIEPDILLLNCGCDSSYPGQYEEWHEDRRLWQETRKQPRQPALTQTCVSVRTITLPMYYQHNTFRAHYCYAADFDIAFDWLAMIGEANRRLLRNAFLHDGNPCHDANCPKDIKRTTRKLKRAFDANVEEVDGAADGPPCCSHRVSFGASGEGEGEGFERLFEL